MWRAGQLGNLESVIASHSGLKSPDVIPRHCDIARLVASAHDVSVDSEHASIGALQERWIKGQEARHGERLHVDACDSEGQPLSLGLLGLDLVVWNMDAVGVWSLQS